MVGCRCTDVREVVTLLETHEDGWASVRNAEGQEGEVPVGFLSEISPGPEMAGTGAAKDEDEFLHEAWAAVFIFFHEVSRGTQC